MADGTKLSEMVDAEEARVEAELEAEEQAQLTAEEQKELEEHDRKVMYHFSRFLELTGREMPEGGMICPTCKMGVVDVSPVQDQVVHRCDFCNGLGRTLTGSLVVDNDTRICPRCNGAGYRADDSVTEVTTPGVEMPQIPVIPYTPVEATQVA